MQAHGRDGRFDLVCPDSVVVHHVLIAAVLDSGQATLFLVQQGQQLLVFRFYGRFGRGQTFRQYIR